MSPEINSAVKRGKEVCERRKSNCRLNEMWFYEQLLEVLEAMSEPEDKPDDCDCSLCSYYHSKVKISDPSTEPEYLGIPVCGNDGCKIVGCDGSCVKPSPEPCKHIFTFDKPCSIENVCVKCGFIEQPSPDYKQLYLEAQLLIEYANNYICDKDWLSKARKHTERTEK